MHYKDKHLQHFQRHHREEVSRIDDRLEALEDALENLGAYCHFLEAFLCRTHGVEVFDATFAEYEASVALDRFFAFLNAP